MKKWTKSSTGQVVIIPIKETKLYYNINFPAYLMMIRCCQTQIYSSTVDPWYYGRYMLQLIFGFS